MENTLHTKVMRRIYAVWFVRRVLPLFVLEVGVAGAGLKLLAANVFVEAVLSNALAVSVGNPLKVGAYLGSALIGTQAATQAAAVAILVAGAFLLRDSIRSFVSYGLANRYPAASRS